jgi:hypothetical protein
MEELMANLPLDGQPLVDLMVAIRAALRPRVLEMFPLMAASIRDDFIEKLALVRLADLHYKETLVAS